jgi:hypothetical protein
VPIQHLNASTLLDEHRCFDVPPDSNALLEFIPLMRSKVEARKKGRKEERSGNLTGREQGKRGTHRKSPCFG